MAQLAEFIGNHLLLSGAFIIVFFMVVMLFMSEKMQAFADANTSELTQLVNRKNAVVIDTRNVADFKQGHIVNAINLPLTDIVAGKANLDKFINKDVVVYCATGMSSKLACKHLIKSGIENVYNLAGGIKAWRSDNLPIVK